MASWRSKLSKFDLNFYNFFGLISRNSDLWRKKVMEAKKWITTEQMLENLKKDANHEHEYNLWLCSGFVTSTHWVVYDSKKQMIGHTRNNGYDWYTEAEFLEDYAGCKWWRFA